MPRFLDYDGPPRNLVQDAHSLASKAQEERNRRYKRDYNLFHSRVDMRYRNTDRANVSLPKIWNIVITKVALEMKAIFGKEPWVPVEAKLKGWRWLSALHTQLIQRILSDAGLKRKGMLAFFLKDLFGTAFMRAEPYIDTMKQPMLVTDTLYGMPTGQRIVDTDVDIVRFHVEVLAPWEVNVHPDATNLEEKGGCGFVTMPKIISKRVLFKEWGSNPLYSGFDWDKLMTSKEQGEHRDHFGKQMLQDLGITTTTEDEDVGVLLTYESDERQIITFDGEHVLLDRPNPWRHGRINLSRMIHTPDANTQNQFWGVGEAKPNEILNAVLNDLFNMALDNHNFLNQGMVYHDDTIASDLIVHTVGGRVPITREGDRPISDYVYESFGQNLPSDHYELQDRTERLMDLVSNVHRVQRAEPTMGDETATEVAILKESGDSTQEMYVSSIEDPFLRDFAGKMVWHIEQFCGATDYKHYLGEEGAMRMMQGNPMALNPANPNYIPGGFDFPFKGSDSVVNQFVRQQSMTALAPIALQIPNVLPGWFARKLFESFPALDGLDLDEGIIPDDAMQHIQQVMLAQMGGQPGVDGPGSQGGQQPTGAGGAQTDNRADANMRLNQAGVA